MISSLQKTDQELDEGAGYSTKTFHLPTRQFGEIYHLLELYRKSCQLPADVF